MKRRPALLCLAVLAACQTAPRPYAPVSAVRYSAIGQEPFWMVTIGDDRIVLATGGAGERGALTSHSWPRVLPRTENGVRIWQSDEGTAVITVEARPGRCEGSGGRVYEDQVRVALSGRELFGCGGRAVGGND